MFKSTSMLNICGSNDNASFHSHPSVIQQSFESQNLYQPSNLHTIQIDNNVNHLDYSQQQQRLNPTGKGKNLNTLQSILSAMTERREQGPTNNKGHFTRSRHPTLKIIKNKGYFQQNRADIGGADHDRVLKEMKGFIDRKIDIPDAIPAIKGSEASQKTTQGVPETVPSNQKDAVMEDTQTKQPPPAATAAVNGSHDGSQGSAATNSSTIITNLKDQNKLNQQMTNLTIENKGPENQQKAKPEIEAIINYQQIDLFGNSRLEEPESFFEYKDICPKGCNTPVPDYYIKYVEPVNSEVQNTVEKGWSFKDTMYECTEKKIQELKASGISIRPSDFECVIDHFEKAAINGCHQTLQALIQSFQKNGPKDLDIQGRVTPSMMKQIYNQCWKNQREERKNRSFIRDFWHYQDQVGDDNYTTFKVVEVKNKTNTRGNMKQKMNAYAGAFIERENAVILSDMISHLHMKSMLYIDVQNIEDQQFDLLIGQAANEKQTSPMNERAAAAQVPLIMPSYSSADEKSLTIHSNQVELETASQFMSREEFKKQTLEMAVEAHRDIHQDLRQEQFLHPEPKKIPGKPNIKQQINQRNLNQNIYDQEIAVLDLPAYRATVQAIEALQNPPPQPSSKDDKKKPNLLTVPTNQDNDKKSQRGTSPGKEREDNSQAGDGQSSCQEPETGPNVKPTEKPGRRKRRPGAQEPGAEPDTIEDTAPPEPQDNVVEQNNEKSTRANKRRQLEKNKNQAQAPQPIAPQDQNINLDVNIDDNNSNESSEITEPPKKAPATNSIIEPKNALPKTGTDDPKQTKVEPGTSSKTTNYKNNLFRPPKPQKKNQIAGFNTIRLFTMMMHHLKKDLKLEISGNETIENVFEVNNQGIMKMHPPGSSAHENRNKENVNIYTVPQKIRKITQEVKINNETYNQMFEYSKQKDRPYDQFELDYFKKFDQHKEEHKIHDNSKSDIDLKEKILNKQQKLQELNKEYEQLKNRKFQIRRGRNNRLFYKSMAKTIFDYESDDEINLNKKEKTQKPNEKQLKRTHKETLSPVFSSNIDKFLHKNLQFIDEINKHCTNKRLKKNIFKMEGIRLQNSGKKTQIEQAQFTNAGSDPDKQIRTIDDPVVEKQFRHFFKRHLDNIMNKNSKETVFRRGLDPENVFDGDFNYKEKLEDLDDYQQSMRTQACSPSSENKNPEMMLEPKMPDYDQNFNYGNYPGMVGQNRNQYNMNTINSFSGATLTASPSDMYKNGSNNMIDNRFSLQLQEKQRMVQSLHFYKMNGKSIEQFKDGLREDFKSFKIYCDNQKRSLIHQNPNRMFRQQHGQSAQYMNGNPKDYEDYDRQLQQSQAVQQHQQVAAQHQQQQQGYNNQVY